MMKTTIAPRIAEGENEKPPISKPKKAEAKVPTTSSDWMPQGARRAMMAIMITTRRAKPARITPIWLIVLGLNPIACRMKPPIRVCTEKP